jgi:hypothetical protein
MRVTLAGIVLLIMTMVVALAQTIPAPSVWTNEQGSVLTIEAVGDTGVVKGHFLLHAPLFPACDGKTSGVSGVIMHGSTVFAALLVRFCNYDLTWNVTKIDDKAMVATWIIIPLDHSRTLGGGVDIFTRSH